jgi:phosphatidylglycerophosphatase A
LPLAPGTAGSLAAVGIAVLLHYWLGWGRIEFALLSLVALAPGIWASGLVARSSGKDDPSIVVVDEVVGQWVTLAGVTAFNWQGWLGGFLVFRLFDIWKPPPVRQLERLHGGVGIVADDVMAGIYGALAMHLAGRWDLY